MKILDQLATDTGGIAFRLNNPEKIGERGGTREGAGSPARAKKAPAKRWQKRNGEG
jgi:hypothetical protein